MNLLDTGAAWLLARTHESAGVAAVYVRGATRIDVTIVRTARTERAVDESGLPLATREHSLVISVAELSVTPRAGDRIEETVDGATVIWEVLPVADAPVYRWWDRGKTAYVIDVVEAGA